jgi:predicted SnoaL-like aldol condensation-catalyzing enzyme
MNRKTRAAVAAVGASLIAVSGPAVAHATTPAASATVTTRDGSPASTSAKEKKAVLNLLAAYRTGNAAAFDVINPKKFVQHDPQVADGLSGLKAWLASAPQGQISVKPVRVLVDGTYVLVHSETVLPSGPTVAWDVFRFEHGKIVEHWASRQPEHGPNPAGHTELDGPTAVTDRQATQHNKQLAWKAMASILRDGDFSLLGEPLYNDAGYIQHSEGTTTDGAAATKAVLQQFVESGTLVYTKIEKVLGEGNFVLVIGTGSFGGTPLSFYDMFRVAKGKITEHWDVLEPLTPAAQAKNANGQFDFPQDPLGTPLT